MPESLVDAKANAAEREIGKQILEGLAEYLSDSLSRRLSTTAQGGTR
jgi:hypothetical protein